MELYYTFFLNILSKKWLGENQQKTYDNKETKVTHIYFETLAKDCIVLLGKTENFYFILEAHESEGYDYSYVFYNENLMELLKSYKKADMTSQSSSIQQILKDPTLTNKQLDCQFKITKTLKI
jgi:hypothetical protein